LWKYICLGLVLKNILGIKDFKKPELPNLFLVFRLRYAIFFIKTFKLSGCRARLSEEREFEDSFNEDSEFRRGDLLRIKNRARTRHDFLVIYEAPEGRELIA
jgi:hypothetical protein